MKDVIPYSLLILLLLVCSNPVFAQADCGVPQTESEGSFSMKELRDLTISDGVERVLGSTVTPKVIPAIIIHVYPEDDQIGTGTHLSDAELLAGLETLNDNLAGINCIGEQRGRDSKFTVKLATRTSNGLPTSGLFKVSDPYAHFPPGGFTYNLIPDLLSAQQGINLGELFNPQEVLQIFIFDGICPQGPDMGGCTFYGGIASIPTEKDQGYNRTMIRTDQWYDRTAACKTSSTPVHEIYHTLGMRSHIGANGAGCENSLCKYQGDGICDTPPQDAQLGANTCSTDADDETPFKTLFVDTTDAVQNYMNASSSGDPLLRSEFTLGQIERMHEGIVRLRPALLDANTYLFDDTACGQTVSALLNPPFNKYGIIGQSLDLTFEDGVNVDRIAWYYNGLVVGNNPTLTYRPIQVDLNPRITLYVQNDEGCGRYYHTSIPVYRLSNRRVDLGLQSPICEVDFSFAYTVTDHVGGNWYIDDVLTSSSQLRITELPVGTSVVRYEVVVGDEIYRTEQQVMKSSIDPLIFESQNSNFCGGGQRAEVELFAIEPNVFFELSNKRGDFSFGDSQISTQGLAYGQLNLGITSTNGSCNLPITHEPFFGERFRIDTTYDCVSGLLELSVEPEDTTFNYPPNTQYYWFHHGTPVGTTSSIFITEPGYYEVKVTEPEGCGNSRWFNVPDAYPYLPVIDAGPDQTMFLGDTINLQGDLVDVKYENAFVWRTRDGDYGGENELAQRVTAPGIYTLEAWNSMSGCRSQDTTIVSLGGAVVREITVCAGDTLYGFWRSGTYVVEFNNPLTGVVDSIVQLELTVLAPLNLSATVEPSVGMSDGSISVQPVNGQAPYTYLWSTGDTTATIIDLDPGDYSLLVTDALGCQGTFIYEVELIVSTFESGDYGLWLSSNPASAKTQTSFSYRLPSREAQVVIVDAVGRQLESGKLKSEEGVFDFSLSSPGVYTIHLWNQHWRVSKQLLIQ